ncbi:MAG TPA: hypothetical protein VJH68_00255 [Candidatus Nanoarchaeia archaeon]|nr:hypothetical protein [Candidatus Nanoarchaeia archaeon]
MPRPQFKTKCRVCKLEWVVATARDFPICVSCHLRQIFSEEVTAKKYNFLNLDQSVYFQSRFLRSIRQSYLMYKTLSTKQIAAFKKVAKELKPA